MAVLSQKESISGRVLKVGSTGEIVHRVTVQAESEKLYEGVG